jgi:hypothetical protein
MNHNPFALFDARPEKNEPRRSGVRRDMPNWISSSCGGAVRMRQYRGRDLTSLEFISSAFSGEFLRFGNLL